MRTLAEWLTLQESVHPKTIDMGLARVTQVARALGVDKPACPVITVGGTNGKGSTVVHVEGLLRAGGASTGMFTSPHFLRYNERIRVNGVEVGDEDLVSAFERIEGARGSTTLTFFEFNALAALIIFAERAVDVAVLEVGLGGRLDAVNLVDADVGVVCSVGFDHRDYLGDTLELIGAEKAGIFRSGRAAVLGTADMPASVYAAIASIGAQSVVAGRDFEWQVEETSPPGQTVPGQGRWSYRGSRWLLRDLPPSALAGSIQYRNASTALAAIEALEAGMPAVAAVPGRRPLKAVEVNERTVSEALQGVRLAGRFQVVQMPGRGAPGRPVRADRFSPERRPRMAGRVAAPGTVLRATPYVEWILDIAHNEPAAAIFARHVRERPMPAAAFSEDAGASSVTGESELSRAARTFAVVGILGDKDAKAIAGALEPLVDHWILCALPGPRGTSAEHLADRLRLVTTEVTLAPSVEAGCAIARTSARTGDRILVFGSVYTVGPALNWLGIY